eukprot:TRINITY_DN9779_c0_g1_i1.p1 TRINITY_DN9779_c0_g1~~TRINITY_DN9779_c0_g1_i1.p1  ORF type:complete len:441 (-),score=73.44 TRINITY_DN9779_c0_g1_i1:17-1339(-)
MATDPNLEPYQCTLDILVKSVTGVKVHANNARASYCLKFYRDATRNGQSNPCKMQHGTCTFNYRFTIENVMWKNKQSGSWRSWFIKFTMVEMVPDGKGLKESDSTSVNLDCRTFVELNKSRYRIEIGSLKCNMDVLIKTAPLPPGRWPAMEAMECDDPAPIMPRSPGLGQQIVVEPPTPPVPVSPPKPSPLPIAPTLAPAPPPPPPLAATPPPPPPAVPTPRSAAATLPAPSYIPQEVPRSRSPDLSPPREITPAASPKFAPLPKQPSLTRQQSMSRRRESMYLPDGGLLPDLESAEAELTGVKRNLRETRRKIDKLQEETDMLHAKAEALEEENERRSVVQRRRMAPEVSMTRDQELLLRMEISAAKDHATQLLQQQQNLKATLRDLSEEQHSLQLQVRKQRIDTNVDEKSLTELISRRETLLHGDTVREEESSECIIA